MREHAACNDASVGDAGDYRPGDVVGGKYEVVDIMGRGSNGVTYRALGPDGRAVAVKALSLRSMTGGWKQLELFEREAHVLEGLQHPGVVQRITSCSCCSIPCRHGMAIVRGRCVRAGRCSLAADGVQASPSTWTT